MGRFDCYNVTGKVTNIEDRELDGIVVTVRFYNKENNLIATETDVSDSIKKYSSFHFNVKGCFRYGYEKYDHYGVEAEGWYRND
jgi:hypothetical protein